MGLKVKDKSENLICKNVFISENHKNNLYEIKKKIKHTYKRFDYFKDLEIFLENCFDDNQKNLTDICLHQLNFLKKNLK